MFFGDEDALVDFVRYLWIEKISTTGKYVVIAVLLDPYEPDKNYFKKREFSGCRFVFPVLSHVSFDVQSSRHDWSRLWWKRFRLCLL